ncbi:septum formation inhibitor Maf [Pseudoluteimonas lycopersici]|uniref:7-methyl-GTP pyrophosphatase n=1 Tax=Pseudoluteimonas lycopersici TaxID=1324796 RepID=A0A516V245_9GAMM|nr:Maf family nucleotide pyrophosphatase [Lysobacter lycopersici]QDQ72609.1 septum formation inhibitor Maf [Lysobacter lycopersici]
MNGSSRRLLLASTSPYRRELLSRLRLPFQCVPPRVDETPSSGEAPAALASRLAGEKAAEVHAREPDAFVIGSDQVADLEGRVLGKPGNFESAVAQLRAMSGREVAFHTALCVIGPGFRESAVDTTVVRMRDLGNDEIARYLQAEPAFDCAGSFKAEGLGIGLFEAIDSRDPTALVGLPLIATARLLRNGGFALP